MIIEKYDLSLFIQRFENMNRVTNDKNPSGNFSYEGLNYLFEYLDELYTEENPLKLDVISLCRDYLEYTDIKEYLNNFKNEHLSFIEDKREEFKENLKDDYDFKEQWKHKDQNKQEKAFKEWLYSLCSEELEEEINKKTTLIKLNDDLNEGFIIQSY